METRDYQDFRAMLLDPTARRQMFELAQMPVPTDEQAHMLLQNVGHCMLVHAQVTGALQARVAAMSAEQFEQVRRGYFWRYVVVIVVVAAVAGLVVWNVWRFLP